VQQPLAPSRRPRQFDCCRVSELTTPTDSERSSSCPRRRPCLAAGGQKGGGIMSDRVLSDGFRLSPQKPIPIAPDTGCHSQDPMIASFCRRSHFDLRKERLHVSIPSCLKIGRSPRRADVLFDHGMTWRQLPPSHSPGSNKLCFLFTPGAWMLPDSLDTL
jgi:hypothetical protein